MKSLIPVPHLKCRKPARGDRAHADNRFRAFITLVSIIFVSSLALLPAQTSGPAQPEESVNQSTVSGPIVRSIDIQYVGPSTISREKILGNMRTAVGQPFNQRAVEEDIRSLYATGEVTNVRIFSAPETDGVKAIVVIQTRAVIRNIDVVGNRRLSTRYIKRKITSKEGSVLSEEIVEQDRQKITSLYQDRNYPESIVEAHITYNEQTGNAAINFTIHEGQRSSLHKVLFIGNHHVRASQLRGAMKGTKGKTILSWLTKSGRLDPAKLPDDLQAVKDVYQNKGYADVEIVSTETKRLPNGDVDLYITINEGPIYHVKSLRIEGQQIATEGEVRRFLHMKEGSLYTPKGLKDDGKTLTDYYGSRGYAEARINPEAQPVGPGEIALAYQVEEGDQYFIERINIEGNSTTKDKVIRRELAVAPGDLDNTVLADLSKRRLDNLGYFSKVEINQEDNGIPGRRDLDVMVEEKKTGSLTFGAGFSSIDSIVGQVDLTQGNFDLFNWPTFTGGGQKFRLSLQGGNTRKDATLSLLEPYFLDSRLALGGEAFYHETDYNSNEFNQQNVGFAINVRRGLTRYIASSLEYRFEDININNIAGNSSILIDDGGDHSRSGFRAGLSFDSRDSLYLTRRGTRVDLSPFVAGGILGGNTNIYGISLNGSHYISLPFDTILLFNAELATVDTLPDGNRVQVFDRLFLGGPNNLRGYGFRKVGPKDFNSNPVGGRSLGHGTIEFTFPIIERVRGAVFSDVGFVNQRPWDFNPNEKLHARHDYPIDPNRITDDPKIPNRNPNHSDIKYIEFGSGIAADAGVGLRLDLPIGPIRVDWGYPFTQDGFNRSSWGKFNFNVGYQF